MKIPDAVFDQHIAILGKTGSGKSSVLRHIVEHLLDRKKRVCIVDPKGDWWGLKVSADGKGAGYPVILFGDFKKADARDVPINDRSGKHIADLITSGNRPCVIGLRGWSQGAMTRFWVDFASGLFNANSGEMYLVGDEFHNFAPKQWKGMSDRETPVGVGLHWSNRLLSEGRGLGLVCMIASQRPQKVHNDTLTSCETLFAMRVVHAADREAVKTWIDGNGDPEVGKEVLRTLAALARGEAWVWSPEIGFGPKRIAFPMFRTFDSFAPPQLQGKVSSKGWADVNLDAVRTALSEAVREAEANDPKLLRKQIAELTAQLKKRPAETKVETKTERVEVPVLKDGHLQRTEKIIERTESLGQKLLTEASELRRLITPAAAVKQPAMRQVGTANIPQSIPTRPKPSIVAGLAKIADAISPLPIGERKVLAALIQYPDGLRREQLTVITGYKRSSRDAYIQRLREKGLTATDGERVIATEAGIAVLPDYTPLPRGQELQDYWLAKLPQGERAILEVLIHQYPSPVRRDALDEVTGYKRSSRDAYLNRLAAKELVEDSGRGEVRASEELFNVRDTANRREARQYVRTPLQDQQSG